MSNVKIKNKRYHLLWDTAAKEVVVDYEATNPLTVTECTRDGIDGAGYATKTAKDKAIKDKKLQPKTDNRSQEYEA